MIANSGRLIEWESVINSDLPGMGTSNGADKIKNADEMLDFVVGFIDNVIGDKSFSVIGYSFVILDGAGHNLAELLTDELSEAFDVKNEKALKRYVELLVGNVMDKESANSQFTELRGDIKAIVETMREGFRQIDKRFEELIHHMDKRFEDLNKRIGFMSWFIPTFVTILISLVLVVMKYA